MRIILVRHGQSDGNVSGIVQGRLDLGLSALGRGQSEATGKRLAGEGVDAIVSSPLLRARDTALVIAEQAGREPELEDALAEYDPGAISGLTQDELREQFPDIARNGMAGGQPENPWPPIPDEEGREAFVMRVHDVIDRLVARDETVVAVTHGGVVNAACHYVMGLDYLNAPQRFRAANCSVTELRWDRQGRLVLARHNDTCHLGNVTQANPG